MIVFVFSDNLSTENSKSSADSGIQLFGCMDDDDGAGGLCVACI